MRNSGILLPIFSLPSKYGIGCFSEEAFDFIDFLAEAGQKYWQILPLGPTGWGNSPYQSHSTFAGNPYFIDLEHLANYTVLLSKEDIENCDWGDDSEYIDYDKVILNKMKLLKKAYNNNKDILRKSVDYKIFCKEQKFWLDGYVKYMSLLESEEEDFYRFQQFLFYNQWNRLKSYANYKGIEIIGDLPIYVSLESSDVFDNPELFQLESNMKPKAVAGCPPDMFSEDGQLWGNPLYNWNYHKDTNYKWWVQRIQHSFELYDIVRIDHFRALYDYYSIPFGSKNAKSGEWKLGPGMDLFNAIKKELGDVSLIAEDLGILSLGVYDLLKETGYPGMKILHFAFDSDKNNPYLPENISENYIVYSGTHDNDTTVGWYEKASEWEKKQFHSYVGNGDVHWEMINLAMSTKAKTCIIPIQDYLGLGSEARINTPGTVGKNWSWRLKKLPSEELAVKIKEITEKYGRS